MRPPRSRRPALPPLSAAVAAVALLAACPICPAERMRIVEGNQAGAVVAADVVHLEARYGSWRAGAGHCGAHWFVDGIEGGNSELGTIDDCGVYRAPAAFPRDTDRIEIIASEYPLDGCLDCCPSAAIDLYAIH